jgi:hypothetical protein
LAVVAAVMVVLALAVVLLASDEERASQYADAAAEGNPDAIFGLFVERYRTGDVEGALLYLDADLEVPFTNLGDPMTWMAGLIEYQAALYGRDEPGPSVCEGTSESGWVSCTFTEATGSALAAVGLSEPTYRGKVADGRVVEYELAKSRVEGLSTTAGTTDFFERPLGEYAAKIDPEGMAAQCDVARGLEAGELTSGFPLVKNQQCGAFIAGFLDDYLATLSS